jgi:hypothetical protein
LSSCSFPYIKQGSCPCGFLFILIDIQFPIDEAKIE